MKRSRMKRPKSFSQKYDGTGERYGPLFLAVRGMQCWLEEERYVGPGHEGCWRGAQGGHTAHHLGRLDREGLIPGCGRAHDLYAGLGGALTVQHFRDWLAVRGCSLNEVGQLYVARAAGINPELDLDY